MPDFRKITPEEATKQGGGRTMVATATNHKCPRCGANTVRTLSLDAKDYARRCAMSCGWEEGDAPRLKPDPAAADGSELVLLTQAADILDLQYTTVWGLVKAQKLGPVTDTSKGKAIPRASVLALKASPDCPKPKKAKAMRKAEAALKATAPKPKPAQPEPPVLEQLLQVFANCAREYVALEAKRRDAEAALRQVEAEARVAEHDLGKAREALDAELGRLARPGGE